VAILKNLIFPTLIFLVVFSLANNKSKLGNKNNFTDSISVRTDFKHYFDECNSRGSVVIFDNNKKVWIVSDTVLSKNEQLPASTFKIINLLIALETGVISDENEIVKWPGEIDTVKYGYRPEIYHDMTVKEAFVVSAGWVFVELAKKIGRGNYRYYLQVCKYGNQNLTEQDIDFWNFGALGISPFNQVLFIRDLFEGKLPFSAKNMEIVKCVMTTEQTENHIIRAKTGWTHLNEVNIGWWVGAIETKQGIWYFATLLLQDRKLNYPDFGPRRKEITKAVFKELGVLKD
jgi:beta-lactamase class D